MNRLVRIELRKIFAKKTIYIFFAIVSALTIVSAVLEKNITKLFDLVEYKANAEMYKQSLENYDLEDPEQLEYYIEDKTEYDTIMLAKDYETYSAEHTYIYSDIKDSIHCMNESKYKTKDDDKYNECKQQYDKQLEFVKNYDWKKHIEEEKESVQDQIQSLKLGINSGLLDEKEYENQLAVLELSLSVLDYRLEHEIPIDSSSASMELAVYLSSYEEYLRFDNEKNIVNREELLEKKNAEANYMISKYKFEHGLIKDTGRALVGDNSATAVAAVFSGGTFSLLFMLIIAGGIVAEEFNKGTIKQLLLKPYSRGKILTSKIIASIIVFVLFMMAYGLMTGLVNGIVFGDIKSLFEPMLVYDFNKSEVIKQSLFINCFEKFISVLPMFLILLGVSILFGVLTTNVATAIVIPLACNIGASIINAFARGRLFAFLPTMCWNLTEFLHGGMPTFKYLKLPICIVVDVITIVLLYGFSYFFFKKKDIKNQ